ncbi:hypothetical protein AAFG13_35410 [Bradyrhizobium sp. B124]|uniref:hypothetical protein n=1 Tax=Bradyrhizobium sp. B124 TaxID=3140245 RepID=UPI0031841D03
MVGTAQGEQRRHGVSGDRLDGIAMLVCGAFNNALRSNIRPRDHRSTSDDVSHAVQPEKRAIVEELVLPAQVKIQICHLRAH